MHARCEKQQHAHYKNYGGRGIYVVPEWHNFKRFVADMEPRPPGKTLDRIDNNGPYAPWNCRWATRKEQAMNSRAIKPITFNGETLSYSDWAKKIGMSCGGFRKRVLTHGAIKAIEMGAPK